VINGNLPPILRRFQVMADYWTNFRYRQMGASRQCPRWRWSPANINFTSSEIRGIVLPDAENHMIISSFVWTKHWNARKGRKGGQTDGQNPSS